LATLKNSVGKKGNNLITVPQDVVAGECSDKLTERYHPEEGNEDGGNNLPSEVLGQDKERERRKKNK